MTPLSFDTPSLANPTKASKDWEGSIHIYRQQTYTTATDDKNLVRIIFDNEHYRSIDASHAPVESVETEAVVLGTVQ